MILWLLLTACGAYLISSEPRLAKWRAARAARGGFLGHVVRCVPCSFGWPGGFLEAFLQTGQFVPEWLARFVPQWVVWAISPPIAAACAVGIGSLVQVLSPLALLAARKRGGIDAEV